MAISAEKISLERAMAALRKLQQAAKSLKEELEREREGAGKAGSKSKS